MRKSLLSFLSIIFLNIVLSTEVYINLPLYINAPISISNLNLEIDSQGIINNQNSINLDADLINNKDSLPSIGNFSFEGNQTQTISGNQITFDKILLNKIASTLEVNTNIIIEDTIALNNGIIDLNTNTLRLGTNAYITNETNDHYITGFGSKIITLRNINNPTNDNIGGIGATIMSGQNLGLTTIERMNISFTIFGLTSASRSYKIIPTNNSNLDATLKLQYLESELNGLLQSSLAVYQSTDNGFNWSLLSTNLDSMSNTITISAMNIFNMYTFSDFTTTPLPVELVSFTAKSVNKNQVLLEWETASEINNDYFEIERATNDLVFSSISEKIWSKGNGSETHFYEYVDIEPLNGTNYYRLKQIDLDGSIQYSDIQKIDILYNDDDNFVSNIYPTVLKKGQILNINTLGTQNQTKSLYLFTENGRLLKQVYFDDVNFAFSISQSLQEGVYFINLVADNHQISSKKIIITE